MSVFANGQMSKNTNRFADGRQFIVARERNEDFVADAADVNNRLRRQRADKSAIEKRDHGNCCNVTSLHHQIVNSRKLSESMRLLWFQRDRQIDNFAIRNVKAVCREKSPVFRTIGEQ